MSLKEAVRKEFHNAPITITATVVSAIIAVLGLIVAWLQYAGAPAVNSGSSPAADLPVALRLSNLLFLVSFFLAASFTAASFIRILALRHSFAATVLSIPAAVMASFCTLLVLKLSPPRLMTPQLFTMAQDIVFWSTLFIFVALNGLPVLRDFAESKSRTSNADISATSQKHESDALGGFAAMFIMLVIWGGLVSSGLSKLTQLFLT